VAGLGLKFIHQGLCISHQSQQSGNQYTAGPVVLEVAGSVPMVPLFACMISRLRSTARLVCSGYWRLGQVSRGLPYV